MARLERWILATLASLGLAKRGTPTLTTNATWFPQLDDAFDHYLWTVDDRMEEASLRGLSGILRDSATLYQDLPPEGVLDMLRKVGAKPGDKFYDLGAGPGKTVGIAYLAGLNAVGVELAESRVVGACKALTKLHASDKDQHGSMSMIRGSFTDVDFSDADIAFFDVAKCGKLICGPEYMKMVDGLIPSAMAMRKGTTFVATFEFLPMKPNYKITAECHRDAKDTFRADERDQRFQQRLCGMTYYIYEMPGPRDVRPARNNATTASSTDTTTMCQF